MKLRPLLSLSLIVVAACGGRTSHELRDDGAASGAASGVAGAPGGGASTGGAPSSGGVAGAGSEPSGGEAGFALGGGDTGPTCDGPGARFVTNIVDFSFGGGQNHNQASGFPTVLFGPPVAGDTLSVVSLGNGGWVIVEFEGNEIRDGEGPDFVVFENPLPHFVEFATVAVSLDGEAWFEFPCTVPASQAVGSRCAGVGPVHSRPENGIDPLDPDVAGGDWFDLAELGLAGARYVRITDRVDLTGPSGVFDLDAVGIRNVSCP